MSLSVLLVDDNPAYLDAASGLLRSEGFTVLGTASTAAQAVASVRAMPADVILIDIGLGQESGFDLARQLAEEPAVGAATVILISTHSEEDFADLIADSPAHGFLPKSALAADPIRRLLRSAS